jgi:hypothetical protein
MSLLSQSSTRKFYKIGLFNFESLSILMEAMNPCQIPTSYSLAFAISNETSIDPIGCLIFNLFFEAYELWFKQIIYELDSVLHVLENQVEIHKLIIQYSFQ